MLRYLATGVDGTIRFPNIDELPGDDLSTPFFIVADVFKPSTLLMKPFFQVEIRTTRNVY